MSHLKINIYFVGLGFTLTEFHSLPTSPNDVEICHFSYDGKLLATGGHDNWVRKYSRILSKIDGSIEMVYWNVPSKYTWLLIKWSFNWNLPFCWLNKRCVICYNLQATFWCTKSLRLKSKIEEHSQSITDARFSPRMPRFATSSADKTVRVWDADNVSMHFLSPADISCMKAFPTF